MVRPLLLLDVDGPLNPWAAPRCPPGYRVHKLAPAGWVGPPLTVRLNPDDGRRLTGLVTEVGLELVWATTWEHEANRLISPAVGLPVLPVIEFGAGGYGRFGPRGWKFPSVFEFGAGRPLVWLDDDFRVYPQLCHEFYEQRGDLPTCLVQVNPERGITDNVLQAVRDWAAELTKEEHT